MGMDFTGSGGGGGGSMSKHALDGATWHSTPTDITTYNASTSAHGLLPKLPNNAGQYFGGTGVWGAITVLGTITTGVWTGTPIAILNGGTGATAAGPARTALGLAIGSDVQGYNASLAAIAAGTWTGASSITTLGTVTTGTLSTGTVLAGVTMTLGSDADGDMYYRSSNVLTRLAKGTAYQTLRMNSGATAPEWAASGSYREFWVDAAAMAPRTTNGAAAATEEYATNDIMSDHYLFDSVTEEGVQFKLAMPDKWDRGTIKVKFFWDAATGASASDGVTWGISAQALGNDDAIDNAFGASVDTDDVVIAVGDLHWVTSAAVTVAGTPAIGDLIFFEITRVVGDAQDDMAEDAKLGGIQIQYNESSTPVAAW